MPLLKAYKTFAGSRQWDAAATIAGKGMEGFPESPLWPMLCARAFTHAGRHEEALRHAEIADKLYRSSHDVSARDMADMWLSLGLAVFLARDYALAASTFAKTLEHEPDNVEAVLHRGIALQNQGRPKEAAVEYRKVLLADPDNSQARYNLLLCFSEGADLDEKRAPTDILPAGPASEEEACLLGSLLQNKGRIYSAREVWERYLQKNGPSFLLETRLALQAPSILADGGEACRIRERMSSFMDRAEDVLPGALATWPPLLAIPIPPFYLAFHGKDDRDILSRMSGFVRRHLDVPGPASGEPQTDAWSRMASLRSPEKRRIGFISRYMTNHTIMSYFFRMLLGLGSRLPQCFFLEFAQGDNVFRADLARTSPMVTLPRDLGEARKAIHELDLDILVYLDIGMDPVTWFLAHSRLAPVQCALYGHPMTTGIPGIDFFLSTAVMEPEGAARHYRETLVTFPGLLSGFMPPPKPVPHGRLFPASQKRTHTEYVCAQSLFKVHPDMDGVIRHILDNDHTARVHFFVSGKAHETKALQARLDCVLGPSAVRVNWLPQCSEESFLAILQQADAVLDTPHFSGGGTSYKALGTGVPVVTLEGEFMRGRQTAGLYRHLGIDGCIASGLQDWGDMALALAHSPDKRAMLRNNLLERRAGLFDVEDSVGCMADFLLSR